MKGLKKIALASAVAAAPFAQAELVAVDDAVLEEMTGQDGVTIELAAQVSVGSFVYTDTDGYSDSGLFTLAHAAEATNGAGTFSMNNIVLGGAGGAGALDDIKIDIDIDAQDGLVIHLGATNTAEVIAGVDLDGNGLNAVDFGLSVGSVQVNSTTLASNIAIDGFLGPIDVVIDNAGVIHVDAFFEVTSGQMGLDVVGMGITNLTVGDDNSPIASDATYAGAIATAAGVLGTTAGVDNMAYVGMTIQTVNTGYFDLATQSTVVVANALNINIDSMAMDITASVELGDVDTANLGTGRALGDIAINDLNLSGTSLTIYGH